MYFLSLSYRNTTTKAISGFVHRSHVSIWKWIQRYKPQQKVCISQKEKKIEKLIVDERNISELDLN